MGRIDKSVKHTEFDFYHSINGTLELFPLKGYFTDTFSELQILGSKSSIYMFRRELGNQQWVLRGLFSENLLGHDLIDMMPKWEYYYWNDLRGLDGIRFVSSPHDPPTPNLNPEHFELVRAQKITMESVEFFYGGYHYRLGVY